MPLYGKINSSKTNPSVFIHFTEIVVFLKKNPPPTHTGHTISFTSLVVRSYQLRQFLLLFWPRSRIDPQCVLILKENILSLLLRSALVNTQEIRLNKGQAVPCSQKYKQSPMSSVYVWDYHSNF